MAKKRIIAAEQQTRDEDRAVFSLRPTCLNDIIGQRQVVDQLQIAIAAARKRAEPLEHVLLDGPPGLGKTTLAHVMAAELDGREPKVSSGPALHKTSDLIALIAFSISLTRLAKHLDNRPNYSRSVVLK